MASPPAAFALPAVLVVFAAAFLAGVFFAVAIFAVETVDLADADALEAEDATATPVAAAATVDERKWNQSYVRMCLYS